MDRWTNALDAPFTTAEGESVKASAVYLRAAEAESVEGGFFAGFHTIHRYAGLRAGNRLVARFNDLFGLWCDFSSYDDIVLALCLMSAIAAWDESHG